MKSASFIRASIKLITLKVISNLFRHCQLLMACFLFMFISDVAIGQQRDSVEDFYDNHWKVIPSSKGAQYFRTVRPTNSAYLARYYTMSGNLQFTIECSSYKPMIRDGKTTVYNNGVVIEETMFRNNELTGMHRTYYPSGKPRLTMMFSDNVAQENIFAGGTNEKYFSLLSEDGKELLPNGTGVITPEDDQYVAFHTVVRDSMVIATYLVDPTSSDTIYFLVEEMPEYFGGNELFVKSISTNVNYPVDERTSNAVSYVSFIVDTTGEMTACSILSGESSELNDAILNTICGRNNWRPGMHRSKPVRTCVMFPVRPVAVAPSAPLKGEAPTRNSL